MIARIHYDNDGVDMTREVGRVENSGNENPEFPAEMNSFQYKSIWVSQSSDMEKAVPATALGAISHLTGAALVENLNRQSIFVGGHSHVVRDRAVHKLNIIEKYYVSYIKNLEISVWA